MPLATIDLTGRRFGKLTVITVCSRWESFEAFLTDMEEHPLGTTIDRIDGKLGYSPSNCTAAQQAQNRPGFALTEDQTQEICGRWEHGESIYALSERFDVRRPTIRRALGRGGAR